MSYGDGHHNRMHTNKAQELEILLSVLLLVRQKLDLLRVPSLHGCQPPHPPQENARRRAQGATRKRRRRMKKEEEDTTDEDDAEGVNHLRERTCVCVQKTVIMPCKNMCGTFILFINVPIYQRTYLFFRAVKTLSCQDSAISKLSERHVTPLHIMHVLPMYMYFLRLVRQTVQVWYGKVWSDRLFSEGLVRQTDET